MSRPKHTDDDIEQALQSAEALNWDFIKSGPRAHPFGKLRCPYNDQKCENGGQVCQVSVWSTPRRPTKHAQQLSKFVQKCERADRGQADE